MGRTKTYEYTVIIYDGHYHYNRALRFEDISDIQTYFGFSCSQMIDWLKEGEQLSRGDDNIYIIRKNEWKVFREEMPETYRELLDYGIDTIKHNLEAPRYSEDDFLVYLSGEGLAKENEFKKIEEEKRKKEILKREKDKTRRLAPQANIIDCTETSFPSVLQTTIEMGGEAVAINVSKFRVSLDFDAQKATVGRIKGRGVTDKTECALNYDEIIASLKGKGL